MKAYRFQDKNRSIDALMDPEQQYSYSWDLSLEETDAVRHGISACESLADLAAYVACSGLQANAPGLIVLEGTESEDAPLDADQGEVLVLPTAARWADEATETRFFDVVGELADMFYSGQPFEAVREAAQDLI